MKKLAAIFVTATLLLNVMAPTLAYTATYLQGTQVNADTHYGSTQCLTQAKAKGVTLLAPAMSPKGKGQGKLTLEDFELDTSGHIQRCPAGHAPLETSVSKKRLQVRFAIDVCGQCPLQDRCPIKGKERLQYTHERVKQRARRLSEDSDAFRDRYRLPSRH